MTLLRRGLPGSAAPRVGEADARLGSRLDAWCGGVLVFGAALTPLLAWLGPLGYAPAVALLGLLCLPALRIGDDDRIIAVALLAGLVWAAISTTWSPFQPDEAEDNVALKLALQLPLYWAAVCGARRASPAMRRRALLVFAWGMAALGVLMVVEALTGAAVYQAVRFGFYQEEFRADLARRNVAQASFVLALLWPIAAAGGVRAGAPPWLALPMIAGALALGVAFGSDAPLLALVLAPLAGLLVWRAPTHGPKALAASAAVYVLLAPVLVLAARGLARSAGVVAEAPASWAQRTGYWSHAVDWISDHPLRGWGLDASRMFGPGIQLHPHNGALQLWLELGVVGAAAGAVFWAVVLWRLSDDRRTLIGAATAATATAYLTFGAFNFGLWQEWWLAIGALAAVNAALASGAAAPLNLHRTAAKASTSRAFSR